MSRKLDLDFIEPAHFALTTWNGLGLFMLALGMIFFVLTLELYQNKQVELFELSSKLNRLNNLFQHKKIPVKTESESLLPEKKLQIESTVAELTVPWSELFLSIEKSDTDEIALLGLEPNVKKQLVVLKGEAKNLQAVLTYINRLAKQTSLSEAYLQKHSIDETDPFKPVKFTVVAKWRMAGE